MNTLAFIPIMITLRTLIIHGRLKEWLRTCIFLVAYFCMNIRKLPSPFRSTLKKRSTHRTFSLSSGTGIGSLRASITAKWLTSPTDTVGKVLGHLTRISPYTTQTAMGGMLRNISGQSSVVQILGTMLLIWKEDRIGRGPGPHTPDYLSLFKLLWWLAFLFNAGTGRLALVSLAGSLEKVSIGITFIQFTKHEIVPIFVSTPLRYHCSWKFLLKKFRNLDAGN